MRSIMGGKVLAYEAKTIWNEYLEQGIKALVTDHLEEGFSKRADPGKIGETILFGQRACEDII